jgi:hypothetical protein
MNNFALVLTGIRIAPARRSAGITGKIYVLQSGPVLLR